jgi:hypothetical protein
MTGFMASTSEAARTHLWLQRIGPRTRSGGRRTCRGGAQDHLHAIRDVSALDDRARAIAETRADAQRRELALRI